MPTYIIANGTDTPIDVQSWTELVDALRAHSNAPKDSVAAFMAAMAQRATLFTGEPVRTTDAETFCQDLIAAGLVLVKADEQ